MNKFTNKVHENKQFDSYEDFLTYKKAYQDEKGYWNCDKNLSISERYQHLFIKNGKLICKFGVIKGKFTFRGTQKIKDRTNEDILTSLKGMPIEVYDNFSVAHQKGITSPIGMPKKVGNNVEFRNCKLTTLEGLPAECENLILPGNQFKDLSGLSSSTRGIIDVSYGKLESLEGIKTRITCGYFHARPNKKLKTIKGIEKINSKRGYVLDHESKIPEWIIYFLHENKKNDNIYLEILQHIIDSGKISRINELDWPEGFLNDNLKKSAKGISKFNI